MNDLEASWQSARDAIGLAPPSADVLGSLPARWPEPHRKYHAPQHLRECLALFERHRALAVHPGAVADAPRFAEYERQIRDEYRFVPEDVFREKRGEILRGFLARPALFSTPAFVMRYEAPARANLAGAITGLA